MSAEVALLRHKARRCRELAMGRRLEVTLPLRKLADEFDAEADALEASIAASQPQPAETGYG